MSGDDTPVGARSTPDTRIGKRAGECRAIEMSGESRSRRGQDHLVDRACAPLEDVECVETQKLRPMRGEVVLLGDDLAGRGGEYQIVVQQRVERFDVCHGAALWSQCGVGIRAPLEGRHIGASPRAA
jgi:hypothetical protein